MKSLRENGWRIATIVSTLAVVMLLVNAALAQESRRAAAPVADRPDTQQAPERDLNDLVGAPDANSLALAGENPNVTPTLSCAGGAHRRTWVYTHPDAHITTSAAFVVLDTVTVTAAPGTANTTERILARFSAESVCYGGTAYCTVRILINGVEAAPAVGSDFAFDSTDSNTEGSASWEAHAMQRCRFFTIPSTGTYPVQLQWGVSSAGTGTNFRIDDYTLTVEQFD